MHNIKVVNQWQISSFKHDFILSWPQEDFFFFNQKENVLIVGWLSSIVGCLRIFIILRIFSSWFQKNSLNIDEFRLIFWTQNKMSKILINRKGEMCAAFYDLRIGSFALHVYWREVLALRHVHLEGQVLVVVLQGELHLAGDDHGSTTTSFTRSAVHRRHRVRTCLESHTRED